MALMGSASMTMAVAPGGENCGWGNMLMEGSSGLPSHMIASITNGTSGNATFGMTSGTNGCSADGQLTYGGKSLLSMTAVMDEFVADAANGQGEAMDAVAVAMGVTADDRAVFADVVHQNFDSIFSDSENTAEDVFNALVEVMKNDQTLAKYVA